MRPDFIDKPDKRKSKRKSNKKLKKSDIEGKLLNICTRIQQGIFSSLLPREKRQVLQKNNNKYRNRIIHSVYLNFAYYVSSRVHDKNINNVDKSNRPRIHINAWPCWMCDLKIEKDAMPYCKSWVLPRFNFAESFNLRTTAPEFCAFVWSNHERGQNGCRG